MNAAWKMRALLSFPVVCLLTLLPAADSREGAADGALRDPDAVAVIARYLALPHPAEDRLGEARMARLKALDELKGLPDAPQAIAKALLAVKEPGQRRELVETLRHFPTRENANELAKLLDDPDEGVRGEAIGALRLFARRVDRIGPERRQRGNEFPPAVQGLLPILIKAAGDPSEVNRVGALLGVADTLEPEAVLELRRRLEDRSDQVRLYAACLLTEFEDARGIPEMKRALEELRTGRKDDFRRYWDAGRLICSFERITGKTFGPIPMSPMLHSLSEGAREAEETFERLIETWSAWWSWEPDGR